MGDGQRGPTPPDPGIDGSNAAPRSSLRVLVVDDNVDAADTLAMLLKLEGHEVLVGHDGRTGLQLAADFRPDVALLDIGMPGMSGHDLARALRRLPGQERILLVAVTGFGRDVDRSESRDAGFDEHFTKPLDPQRLLTLLASRATG